MAKKKTPIEVSAPVLSGNKLEQVYTIPDMQVSVKATSIEEAVKKASKQVKETK